MKTFIQTLLFSLFICCSAIAQVPDFHFNSFQIRDITEKNGIIAVLGFKNLWDNNGKSKSISLVSVKKNGDWQNLPITIDKNGKVDSINSSAYSKIQIDSKENIWISGKNGIYKFDGTKWNEYTFSDSLFERFDFWYLFLDNNDKVILSCNMRFTDSNKEYFEFLKFENDSISIIKSFMNPYEFTELLNYNEGINFVGLQDGSVIIGHKIDSIYDLTKISAQDIPSVHQMITFDQHKGTSNKYVSKIIQHSDGTIWFAHSFGSIFIPNGSDYIESWECCTGISLSKDLENFSFLGKDNDFPGGDFPLSTTSIAELPNNDVLIITNEERFGFYLYDYKSKTVKSIDKSNFYKNAKLILANDNPYNIQHYTNFVDTLKLDIQNSRWNRDNFQNLLIDEKGTIYMNYKRFLLEIPSKNVTSVEAGEFTDALRVFPNPAETSIKIEGTKEIRSVTATNILGSEVLLNLKENNSFGISNLSTGLYTLLIQHLDGSTSRTMFVKK